MNVSAIHAHAKHACRVKAQHLTGNQERCQRPEAAEDDLVCPHADQKQGFSFQQPQHGEACPGITERESCNQQNYADCAKNDDGATPTPCYGQLAEHGFNAADGEERPKCPLWMCGLILEKRQQENSV